MTIKINDFSKITHKLNMLRSIHSLVIELRINNKKFIWGIL